MIRLAALLTLILALVAYLARPRARQHDRAWTQADWDGLADMGAPIRWPLQ